MEKLSSEKEASMGHSFLTECRTHQIKRLLFPSADSPWVMMLIGTGAWSLSEASHDCATAILVVPIVIIKWELYDH